MYDSARETRQRHANVDNNNNNNHRGYFGAQLDSSQPSGVSLASVNFASQVTVAGWLAGWGLQSIMRATAPAVANNSEPASLSSSACGAAGAGAATTIVS